jgi:hypothetical protein
LNQTWKRAWSDTRTGPRPTKALVLGCIGGAREGEHNFSLGLNTTVLQAEICTIKIYIVENTEKDYTRSNIRILTDRQVALKTLDSFQRESQLVWDCHQSLGKLAEHNNIEFVCCQDTRALKKMK